MGDFVDAALSFPAVLLSFLLVAVVLYWLLVLVGTLDVEIGDLDIGGGLGLGGVPVTVTVSILTVVAWFVSLVGTVLIDGNVLLGVGVLLVALLAGLFVARLVVVPLRRLYLVGGEASRSDFVGRECVIRTGSVTDSFGQAEVTAVDGSSAIVQVRQTGEHQLSNGHRALIFEYDTDGEFFWVAPAT
jgi:hypothetical protein